MGSTFLDRTPDVSGNWCGGSDVSYKTMERYDPTTSGESCANNWNSFQSILANGLNADSAAIHGTPGKRNSMNYLLSVNGSSLPASKTLTAANSPYLITASPFTVGAGKNLTIEAGAVIKFYTPTSYLKIDGTLNVQGTSGSPVVFTSFKDDTYGGDTNQNGSTSSPQAGDWGTIKITAAGSTIDRALIRYGGFDINSNGDSVANLLVENSSLTLTNSTVEYSGAYGLRLISSSGTYDSNTFRYNNLISSSAGMRIETGNPVISNNTFSNNYYGISSLNATYGYSITNNTFTSNTDFHITAINGFPTTSGNTATSSGINIQGSMGQDFTLSSDLPYVIATTLFVQSGKTLTIPAGAILKFNNNGALTVNGRISVQGTSGSKVVFTSIKDDAADAGIGNNTDTNGDGSATTPAAGDWNQISLGANSSPSNFTYAVIRYGSQDPLLGALKIADSSITIQNSTFANNYSYGVYLNNSTSTSIVGSTFQNHTDPPNFSYGLYLVNSTPTVQGTTFSGNSTGAARGDGTSVIHDGGISNIFPSGSNTTDTTPVGLIQP